MLEEIEAVILHWISAVALAIEVIAVTIIILAIFGGLYKYVRYMFGTHKVDGTGYNAYRKTMGRSLLLGLEILVAADVIKTVALDTTVESVMVLGMLVLIRIFLGWSLIVELEGRWPWQPIPKVEDDDGGDADDL